MPSKAPAAKAAVYAACASLFSDPVQVVYGHPGTNQEDDIVAVRGVRSLQDVATMGTGRAREETLEIEVVFSCYRGGGEEAQQVATERAYALLGLLEDHLQTTDYTLGGVVRLARVTESTLAESDDPDVLAMGRVAEIAATVTCQVRI